MKKVECFISEKKENDIKEICQEEGYTRAEFLRRAIEKYLEEKILNKKNIDA